MSTKRCRAALLGVISILAVSLPVHAADEPMKNTIDLGFVNAAGNMDVTSLSVADHMTYSAAPWRATGLFSVLHASSNGEDTANWWQIAGRGERDIAPNISIYVLAGWDKNRFAGIDRRFQEGAGLSFRILDTAPDRLSLDAGIGFIQQRNTLDANDDFVSARIAATYQHDFADKAYFLQTVELLPNLEKSKDLRINTESAVVAPMWHSMAVRLAYLVRYDRLPEPTFEKTDRIFTAGLQYSF